MPADHQHRLQKCHECDGTGWARWSDSPCADCDSRGYLRPEVCAVCHEPMGNARRWWKRLGRPADWWTAAWERQNPPR